MSIINYNNIKYEVPFMQGLVTSKLNANEGRKKIDASFDIGPTIFIET